MLEHFVLHMENLVPGLADFIPNLEESDFYVGFGYPSFNLP